MTSEVPLPFGDTFALQKPTVASASPACVAPGSSFAIAGTGFYPSLVTGVLIGGTPLSPAQFTATSDILINAVAPGQSGKALPVVVQTAEGLSNADVTIKIGKCGS